MTSLLVWDCNILYSNLPRFGLRLGRFQDSVNPAFKKCSWEFASWWAFMSCLDDLFPDEMTSEWEAQGCGWSTPTRWWRSKKDLNYAPSKKTHKQYQTVKSFMRFCVNAFCWGGWVVKHHPSKGRLNALKMIFKFHLVMLANGWGHEHIANPAHLLDLSKSWWFLPSTRVNHHFSPPFGRICFTSWWLQRFFIFTLTWGNDLI